MTAKESQMFVRALLFAVLSSKDVNQMRNAVLAIADKEDVEHVTALLSKDEGDGDEKHEFGH